MKTTGPDKIYTEIKKEATNSGFIIIRVNNTINTKSQLNLIFSELPTDLKLKYENLLIIKKENSKTTNEASLI